MKTNLPPYWQIERLGDVCVEIIGGGTPSTNKNEFWDGNIPWITSADISGIREVVIRKKTNENGIKNSSTNLLPKGSIIVVTRVGLGKIAIAPCDLCFSQDCQGLILKNEVISNSYALYFLSKAVQVFKYESRGTTINGVTKKQLVNLQIPVPPLPEQEQIVAKIEELFSELDAGIENIKTAQEQLKVYRQSLLKWAFEGKLTNENVKDGGLPKGWRKEKLKNLTSILGDGLHGTPNYFENGEYYFINGNNLLSGKIFIKNNTKRVDEKEYNKHKKPLDESSVLVSINGTIGNTAFYKGEKIILGKSACYFNLLENVSKFYIRYFIMSPMFMQYANKVSTGSTIKNLSLKSMRDMLIPLPCFDEQLKIVEELESRLTVCDKLEEDIEFSLAKAESLRQSILKQAFEGKLVNFNGETDK